MKNLLKTLAAISALLMVNVAGTALAADAILSPRAQAQADSSRTVASPAAMQPASAPTTVSPKLAALRDASRSVTGVQPDTIARSTPIGSPKGLANAASTGLAYQIAPIK